jgi:hypothetical protein
VPLLVLSPDDCHEVQHEGKTSREPRKAVS